MTYLADQTWDKLSQQLSSSSRNTRQHMREGLNAYDEWTAYKQGKTVAQVATELGRTAAEVTDMNAAFQALKTIHDTAVAGGEVDALRKFI